MSLWVHGDLFSKTIVLDDTSVSVCHFGFSVIYIFSKTIVLDDCMCILVSLWVHGDLFSKTIVLDDTSVSVCHSGFTVIYLVKLLYWMIQVYPCVTLGSR